MKRPVATWILVLILGGCHDFSPIPDAAAANAPPKRASRVIFITVDTLRADVLGAYGGPAHTPELDGWAAQGWRFEHSYSASMLTNPSHASLFTSLYPRDHGVYNNQSGIAEDVRTLPSALAEQGFAAAAVIAFPHLNPEVARLGKGFKRFRRATRREPRAHEQVRRALAELDGLGDVPSFVWLHISDPHAPYEPIQPERAITPAVTPMAKARKAAPGFQSRNPWFKRAFQETEFTEEFYHRYVAEVEAVDRALAELRRGMQARDLWSDTLVVLTSDHGENFGENDLWFHHGGLYDAAVHVPLIFRGPGVKPAVDDRLVEHVDVAPTVLDLLGIPQWQPMRGRSLLAQREQRAPRRDYAFSEHMLGQAISVRDGTWTAILHRKTTSQFPSYPMRAGRRELWRQAAHQIRVDPELHPEPTRRLDRALEEFMSSGLGLQAQPAIDQDRESLRALGYIE